MKYGGAGSGDALQWSTFLVGKYTGGLATPMIPSNATVVEADNHAFVVSYQPLLNGVPQGTLVIRSIFSADVPPTFEADYAPLPGATESFNILWAIAGAPPFLERENGQGENISSSTQLQRQPSANVSATLGPTANSSSWPWSVRVDWSDAGAGDVYTGPIAPFGTSLGSGLYVQFAEDRTSVDPTIIGSSLSSTVAPTGFSSERKTFYWNGFYRAFWDTGSGIAVESSPDGTTWNSNGGTLTPAINPGFDVAERGNTVALAYVNSTPTSLNVRVGTINANQIAWNNSASTPPFGSMSANGVGPVSVTIGADKEIYVSAAWQGSHAHPVTSCDNNSNPCYHDYIFRSTTPSGSHFSLIGNYIASGSTAMAVLVSIPNAALFAAFTNQSTAFISWAIWTGSWEYKFSNGTIKPSGETSTSSGDPALQTGNTAYEMVPAVASTNGWVYIAYMTSVSSIAVVSIVYGTPPPHYYTQTAATCSTCLGGPYVPALGIDSLNTVYLFWDEQASSRIWDIDYAYQDGDLRGSGGFTGPNLLYAVPSGYESYKLSAGPFGGSAATLVWTQSTGWTNQSYAIYFAALPLPTVLGGSPNQPSSRDGLSPYGAYFQQQNEYVGPGNGLLDVVQSDVNLPGRGLSLSVGRVFDEPRDFLSKTGSPTPFLFDNFTGADLGVGWSLTIPWVGTHYLHLPDGEEYPLQFNTSGVYVNRAGTGFALTQNVNCVGRVCTPTGYTLNLSNGVTVLFGASGLPTSETDLTGRNNISFTYAGPNGQLSKITDTVGRMVNLTYNSHNQLQSISWAGRSEQFAYSSTTSTADLASVLDPLSRNTSFAYLSGNPWLMTEVSYPTGGHTNYTYRSASFGEATCYLVSLQNVYNGTALVRSTNFSYDFINGAVTYSKLNISNGTGLQGLQGSVSYSFGAPVGSMAVTEFDAAGRQLQRSVTWYDPTGRPTQTDSYSGNTTTPTSSTYQAFDDWGNLIYTRDAVGHESFASYANTNFTKTFYSPGLLTRTASGRIWSDDFSNHSLNDWTVSSSIQVTLNDTANPPTAPSMKIQSSSSSTAYAYHTFATQTQSFVAEALIQPDSSGQAVWFNLTSGGLSSALVTLEFTAGVLDYCNPSCHSSGASYTPGRWVLVAISANDVAHNYAIWLAGIEYVPGTSFSSPGNINCLVISTRGANGPASVYADNVRVYSNPGLQIYGIDPDSTVDLVSAIDGTTVTLPVGPNPYVGEYTLLLSFRIFQIEIFNQSGGSTPEYISPSTDFSGGDIYSYTLPVWRGGQFYSNSLPTTVHSLEVGSMAWQNGSTDPVLYLDMSTIKTSGFLQDMSGHGNTAALHGPTSVSGIAGKARSFDGSTTYISIPDSQSLEPSTFTVSFWIKPTTWPTTSGLHTHVIAKDSYNSPSGIYRGWIVQWDPSQSTSTIGRLYLAAFSTTSQESDSPRLSLIKNVWQQVTFSFDGTYLHGYLNGTEVKPAGTMAGTYGPSNKTLLIGKGDNSSVFNGSLDELRIYNRAQSSQEISTLATLSLWFDMETFSAGSLVDMSGYQGSGTAVATTPVRGQVGNATSFNGASSYVNATTSGNVSRNFTIDAWVDPASAASGTTYSFFTTRSGSNGFTFDSMLQNGNKIHGEIGTGSAWLTTSADYTFTYRANVWYNIAYVVTATGYSIYVNGTLATTGTYSTSVPLLWDANHYVSIGGDWDSTSHALSEAFSGSIDEVKVWRGALSASQIASLFTAQSTPPARSFYDYNSLGENIADKTYHNGSWLYTNASFDAYGNVVSDTDVNGRVTSITYSSTYQHSYPTQVTYNGSTENYSYSFATGLVTSTTDPRGFTTTYAYDLVGRIVEEIQPAVGGTSPTTNYVYDDVHNVATVYDPDSLPRALHYDMESLSGGRMEDLSGHGLAGVLQGTTSVAGEVGLARQFNGAGDYISSVGSLASSTSLTISAWVNRDSTQVDTRGDVFNGSSVGILEVSKTGVVYAGYYDGSAWHIIASAATLAASTWTHVAVTFAPSGTSTIVDVYINGALDTHSATLSGHPVGSYVPTVGAASATSERFKGILDEVQVFDLTLSSAQVGSLYHGTEGGRYLKEYFDGLGRSTRVVERSFFSGPSTAGCVQETYVNNWQNQVVQYTNPNGSVYRTAFDFLGRATSLTNPDSSVTTISYDSLNRTVTTTDEVGRETQNVYDVEGRLVGVRQYTSSTSYVSTNYTYDLAGELLSVSDPLGGVTRNVYDDVGQLVQTFFPDGSNQTFVYDNLGNVISETERTGRTIHNTYDAFNRVTRTALPGGRSVRYSYDVDGNVLSVKDNNSSIYLSYDNLSRLSSRSMVLSGDSTNYTVGYQYDLAGNLLNLTYPDSLGTLTYAYDAFYQVSSMSFGGTTLASFTYRNDGLLATISFGDGTLQSYTYNGRGFPLEDKVTKGSTTLMDLKYSETAAGDVSGLTNTAVSGDTESYAYDKLDRLTNSSGPWGAINYTYDGAGNRLSMKVGATTTSYHYATYDELAYNVTGTTNTSYSYDANGNLVSRTTGATSNTYWFDIANRLYKAVVGGQPYTFAYDGLDDRVRETGPSGSQAYNNTYVFSGDTDIYRKNVIGTTTTKSAYLYAGELLICGLTNGIQSYYHSDALGNVRMVTQSGVSVFSTNYEPFGVQYASGGSTTPSWLYSGQWSESVGLYWEHARFYDTTLGRFISQDPLLGQLSSPQTLNRYAYATNNPEVFADRTGMDCSWNPFSWVSGCGQSAVNSVSNWWNGLSNTDKDAIIITAVVAFSIVTLGAGLPIAGSLAGGILIGAGAGAAAGLGFGIGYSYATTGQVSPSTLGTFAFAGAIIGATAGAAYGMGLFTNPTPVYASTAIDDEAGAMEIDGLPPEISLQDRQGIQQVMDSLREDGDAPEGFYQNSEIPSQYGKGGPAVWENDKGGLPDQAYGYYREYDIRPYSPGISRGIDRLIVGEGGDIYYTNDHYATFWPIYVP